MRITETVHDESNYEPVPAYPGEKTYDELNIDDYGKSVDYPEHRHRDERRSRYVSIPVMSPPFCICWNLYEE